MEGLCQITQLFLWYYLVQQWYWNLFSHLNCVYLKSCSQAVSKTVWHIPLLCVQWKNPDGRRKNCPKHVEFYFKNKFEKLVDLVGCVIRIYHDVRSPERRPTRTNAECEYNFAQYFGATLFGVQESSSILSFFTFVETPRNPSDKRLAWDGPQADLNPVPKKNISPPPPPKRRLSSLSQPSYIDWAVEQILSRTDWKCTFHDTNGEKERVK